MTSEPSARRGAVAFLGLGTMGAAMAANLARAGFAVTGWNRTPGRGSELASLGVATAETPAAASAKADIVVICVSDTPDVEAVLFGSRRCRRRRSSGLAHHRLLDHRTLGQLGLRRPTVGARSADGRCAGLGRERGRAQRDADDLRRR